MILTIPLQGKKGPDRMASAKPTIQMIADLAGVSRGTVDRVLNNRSYVKKEVRDRILEIVRETGYVSQRESHLQEYDKLVPPLRLGVLLPDFRHGRQFLNEVRQGISQAQAELVDARVEVSIRECRDDSTEEILSCLDSLCTSGINGISICARNDEAVSEKLLSMKEAGIPCVTFNSDLPDSGRLFFCGQDIRKSGRLAAELMGKCVRPGELILAATGNRKYDGHRQRLFGFQERMRELSFPAEDILTAETLNDYSTTVQIVGEALRKHPDLKGIYMANLSVTGCADAVRSYGRSGSVRIICHDMNPAILRLLQEGLIDYTIPQDFIRQGYAPLIYLTECLRGRPLPETSQEDTRLRILCRENI